ncbi:MAG: energy-coupling factor transporter ATPase [Syntrophomonadales bacterium]|jgi:energy-coupling factor transport system ATP-binding protein
MIEVQGVSFNYPGLESPVLQDINLEIRPGEFLALLGRNGSGKSTLTKLLNGLLIPSNGNVVVDGLNTRDPQNLSKIRQQVGLLFSNPDNQLVAGIVEEDVAFGPENLGLPANEIRDRVRWALSVAGMTDYIKYPPHLLSGGQKQRVAIAGILALGPRYMVLDEPTSMLDPQGRDEVLHTLFELNREQGTTIVLVTHFVEEATTADRVVILDQGKLVMTGSPLEVLTRTGDLPNWGLEAPEIVLLCQELRKRGHNLPLALEGKQVVKMIQQLLVRE